MRQIKPVVGGAATMGLFQPGWKEADMRILAAADGSKFTTKALAGEMSRD